MPEAVIVDAVRTPIGRAFKGSLASLRPDETLVHVIDRVLERNPEIDPSSVEEVIAGCGQPQGLQANNIARIAVLLSDKLSDQTTGSTISRYCASGLDAIRVAANSVVAGQGDTYVAAGVEFVSRYNGAQESAHPEDRHEHLQGKNGRPDAFIAMGMTAENVAERYGVSREQQDEYAQRSQERAVRAQEGGFFDREIVPVAVNGTQVTRDDGPRPSSTLERLGGLEPAFRPGGTVTAGNSSTLNDGASAVLIADEATAQGLGIEPLARIVSRAVHGVEPQYFGIGPVEASRKALAKAGIGWDDLTLVELNEAYAAQSLACLGEWPELDRDKVNVNGGAIALGHPLGSSGTRILTTLAHELRRRGGGYGLATLCIGVGQGLAMVIEA